MDANGTQAWGLDSETGRLEEVLLGPPDFFEWRPVGALSRETIRRDERFDRQLAMAQHARMVECYEDAGVKVHWLEAWPELKYAVFARDSSMMTPWGPMIGLIQTPYRRGDYALTIEFYRRQGVPIWKMVYGGHFEGGDFQVLEPGLVLCGYGGERSDKAGAEQVAGWFEEMGWEAIRVPFPAYFVHLDVTVGPLADKLIAVCTEAHEPWFPELLKARGYEILDVTYGEAVKLGCNVVSLGDDRVLSTRDNARLNERLRARGIRVYDPDLSMFTLGGGGPHCLCQAMKRAPLRG
jgi:N-dimethylarginine dimethylaminohydrolase